MHFNILGKYIVILSSLNSAMDLLDKKSSIHSSRTEHLVYNL